MSEYSVRLDMNYYYYNLKVMTYIDSIKPPRVHQQYCIRSPRVDNILYVGTYCYIIINNYYNRDIRFRVVVHCLLFRKAFDVYTYCRLFKIII